MGIGTWAVVGALGASAAIGGLCRSHYERKHFVTEYVAIQNPKVQKKIRLVFLTDLHDQVFGNENEPLLQEIDRIQPDFILSGGDAMVVKNKKADTRIPLALFRVLAQTYPVICANGNHETRMKREPDQYGDSYVTYKEKLKHIGVRHIENGTLPLTDWLMVSSVELEERFYRDGIPARMRGDYLERKLGKPDPKAFQILLLHSPLFFRACREWGADLTLSGHFHGGTIRLPLLGGVMTPQFQFFHPKCAGFFQKGGRYLLVGRGLGTHSINIRIGNKPQLVVIDLLPQERERMV